MSLYDTGHLPGETQAVELVIAVAVFVYAGMTAARQSSRVTVGVLAGEASSVFVAVIILGANVIMAVIVPAKFAHAFGYHDVTTGALLIAAAVQSVVGLIIWALFGLLFGAVGGWNGSKQKIKQSVDATILVAR